VRIQDHLKISAAASLFALPCLKQDVIIPFAASILIDVDHYLWHAIERRTLSLRAALRYFGRPNPPRLARQRLLHHPLVLALLLVVAARFRSRLLRLILAGLIFHVCLDAFHMSRVGYLKRSLSEQADYICPACGQRYAALQLHSDRPARNILDRYKRRHFIVLCPTCHSQAHIGGRKKLSSQA
jgi:hypothetical protein